MQIAVFIVYPIATGFFWSCYLFLLAPCCRRLLPKRYASFNAFNKRCFHQNMLSGLHTFLSAGCLAAALLRDRSLAFGAARLYPHDSFLLYVDIAMSLGYFSFALPISVVMSTAGFPYGSRLMVAHHALVVVAQSTFLLTGYPSGYMAASGLLFELTNIFFVPHLLLVQLSAAASARHALGLCLAFVYTLSRCFACMALALCSVADLRAFAPPLAAGWLFASIGLASFYGLLLISLYWYVQSVLPSVHTGLRQLLGETYCHHCFPVELRRALWHTVTYEGRERSAESRLRFRALQELRAEMAERE